MSRPTIHDVARIAGISIATVSRCLHLPDIVAPAALDRVLAAVRVTGYTMNAAVQSLRQRRFNMVLVAEPGIGHVPFAESLAGVEKVAAAAGRTMLIGDTGRDKTREESWVRCHLNGRADGVLLLAAPQADWFAMPIGNDKGIKPAVTISEVGPGQRTLAVSINNEVAAYAAVAWLVSAGHRLIAHVTGLRHNILTGARVAGYRRALREAGVGIRPGYEFTGNFDVPGGRRAFDALSTLPEPPTAVFCSNDATAMGFIAAAHAQGVNVPRHIWVVGFDDIHFAQSYTPALTTIRQPKADIGAEAMGLLLAVIGNEAPPSVCLPFELVLRDSTSKLL